MSEFLAEARVLISPDTKAFRAELTKQLLTATRGVVVPIEVAPVATKSVAAATAATQGLASASAGAAQQSLALAGAQTTLAASTTKSTAALLGAESASSRLDATLLGLRTIAGSSAVIGLGALALAAIAAGKAIRASIQGAATLEQELNVFRVTAGATAEQMQLVSKAAENLGKDITLPAVTSTDAAVAFTELAKAGLDVQDALEGGRGVLQLSAAAQISFASAAELTANALNAFQLQGSQAVHVADLLANASISAQGSVEDMGLALKQSAAVARQLGLTVETTVAFITELAKAGISGSDAGTSLRVALTRLIAPTKDAQKLLDKFNISLRDVNGNLRTDVFVQLGRALENLGKQQQARVLFTIFGQDAQRAAAVLARDTLPALNETITALEKEGAAAELAGARNVGFAGKLSALQSSLQTLGTAVGKIALGPLGTLADSLTTISNDAILATEQLNAFADAANKIGENLPGGGAGGGFLGQLDRAAFASFADFQTQIIDSFKVIQEEGPKAFTETELSAQKVLTRIQTENERTAESFSSLRSNVSDLFKAFQEGGGRGSATALNEFVLGLQKLAEEERTGLVTNDKLAASIEGIIKSLQTGDFNVDVGVKLDEAGLRSKASQGANIVLDAITSSLSPEAAKAIGFNFTSNVGDGMVEGAKAAAPKAASAGDILAESLALAQAGGNQGQELSILRQREANQQAFLDRILSRPQTKANVQLATKAADNLKRTRDQIKAILDGQAADAKQQAAAIARTQEEATQAFIASFDPRKQKLLNQITNAGLTERLSDDIKFEKQLQAFLIAERKAIKDRIRRLKLHGDALKAAQAAIKAINQEIFQVTNEIAQDQAAQQKRTQDILNQKIDLRIRIAQARGDVAAEIKARKARLDRITAELVKLKNAGKKNTVAWLELKAQQVEEIAAIKELEGEAKKKDNAASSFFNFLQTTQGFAQNLLGNLIPGFATKGLVGGSAGSATGTQDPFAFSPNAAEINTGVRTTAQVSNAMGATVRPVQVDTTNALLRQILATLQGRHTRPPEIVHNRRTGSAAFDTL